MDNSTFDELMSSNPLIDGFETNEPVNEPENEPAEKEEAAVSESSEGSEGAEPHAEENAAQFGTGAGESPENEQNSADASSFGDGSFASYGAPSSSYSFGASSDGAPRGRNPYIAPPPPPDTPSSRAMKTVGWVLFGITALLMIAAFFVTVVSAALPEMKGGSVVLAFLPFPVACLVLGIILKRSGRRMEAFTVIGIVGIAVFIVFSLIASSDGKLSFSDDSGSDTDVFGAADRAEEVIGFELPAYSGYSYSFDTYSDESLGTLELTFSGESAEQLLASIEKSAVFHENIPNTMIGMLPSAYRSAMPDYILIYNVDSAEYNTLPRASREYEFKVILCYDFGGECSLEMLEYTLDYRASFESDM